jgi:chaperonin cofactor prefoldin
MESQDKYLKLITGLKASNITSNIASLNTSSELMETYLSVIKSSNISEVSKKNIERSIDIVQQARSEQNSTDELINLYIKFGDIFKSELSELKKEQSEYLNKIAVQYLTVAKQTKDTRIKNIAVAIAKELSFENND